MNRFFSKLDLRDIKIDPEGSRFPPDADEHDQSPDQSPDPSPDQPLDQASDQSPEDAPQAASDESRAVLPEQQSESNPEVSSTSFESVSSYAVESDTEAHSWIEDQSATPAGLGELEDAEEIASPHLTSSTNGVAPESNGHVTGDEIAAISGEVLKVSARSRPSAVAGAIAGVVRESGKAEVQAIGAGATNQAVKAVAIAREYLRETGIEAVCLPAFIDVTIENEDRTAIRLVVEPR